MSIIHALFGLLGVVITRVNLVLFWPISYAMQYDGIDEASARVLR